MDSILIRPRDEKELNYIIELMKNLGVVHKTFSQEAIDEFEIAMMMKASISTTGILREEMRPTSLTQGQQKTLSASLSDIKEKLIITEQKIQIEEEEWLRA